MRRLNLSTALTIPGDAMSGAIRYTGLSMPTVTQVGSPNDDVEVATDGSFTLVSALGSGNRLITARVQDAAGYWIQGLVNIIGDGTTVPPPPGPTINYVPIGMNLVSITGYNGNYPFANVLANMYPWSRRATSGGSGSWSQNKGSLTASVATDQFTAVILNPNINRLGWTNGTYRVFNPDGCQIAFGYGADSPGSYCAPGTTQFDVSLSPTGSQGVYMFVKGSLTGKVKVVQPGYYDSVGETSTFTTAIGGFYNNLTRGPLRFMDWTMASQNYEVEWADRVTLNHISFSNEFTRRAPCVPWEFCIDLANTLGRDIWICVSPRASADYILQLARLIKARLNAGLNVWIEVGNEIWNYAQPWNDGYKWVTYLHHTLRSAVSNGASGTFTLAGHGLTNDQQIVSFSNPANMNIGLDFSGNYWRLNAGADAWIRYIDADTFSLANNTVALGGAAVPVYSNMGDLWFKVPNEPLKVANRAKHYAELSLRNWDIFDSELGASRVKRLVCGQSGDSTVLGNILNELEVQQVGGRARTSFAATAPYFNGYVFGARLTCASGQFTPAVWCSVGSVSGGPYVSFHFALYAAGSTPTDEQILAGTGAGFINHQVQTNYLNSASWSSTGFVPITGLVDGVSYKAYVIVFERGGGQPWKISGTVTAAASGSIFMWDSYANQAFRMCRDASFTNPTANINVAGTIPFISYEIGADYNFTGPDEAKTWRDGYMESAECAGALIKCMAIRATGGVGLLSYFSDCGSGPFSLASNYADTADERYVAMHALGGQIEKRDALTVANVTLPKIEIQPGAFPYVLNTFTAPGLTYTIIAGNNSGRYTLVGNVLSMATDTGIDWAAPTNNTITIMATDGYLFRQFNVTFSTGVNWYEGDAQFAWSGITDSDPAALNPVKGNALTLTGTAASVASGMWDMGGVASYASASAGSSAGDSPWLVAAVIDRDGDTTGFKAVVQFGNSARFITFYTGGGGATNFTARFYQAGSSDVKFAASAPTGKHVFWAFWDGAVCRAGYDQIENTAAAITRSNFNSGITQYVGVGAATQMKVGAVQSLPRAGMTITDALAIVAKMQTHHSIP